MPRETCDFAGFLRDIGRVPPEGMMMRAMMRMAAVSALGSQDPQVPVEAAEYVTKLAQLVKFLRTSQIPPEGTSEERAIYSTLAHRLLQCGYFPRGASQGKAPGICA